MRRCRLHVTGASGSGTTTLARALADTWAVPHADADDYFWLPTDPPYVDKRPEVDRLALMEQVFLPREGWVLSGSMLGWGDDVVGRCPTGQDELRPVVQSKSASVGREPGVHQHEFVFDRGARRWSYEQPRTSLGGPDLEEVVHLRAEA